MKNKNSINNTENEDNKEHPPIYFRSIDKLHYYKLYLLEDRVLHVMCNRTDKAITFDERDQNGKVNYISKIDVNSACINWLDETVDDFKLRPAPIFQVEDEEFNEIIRNAIFSLDIYKYTI